MIALSDACRSEFLSLVLNGVLKICGAHPTFVPIFLLGPQSALREPRPSLSLSLSIHRSFGSFLSLFFFLGKRWHLYVLIQAGPKILTGHEYFVLPTAGQLES